MPASESPSKLARAVEEGRIMNVSPREKELMSSPTLSTGTTFVGTTNFPSEVEDSPRGFPYVASYLDSEDTFAVFRRFGWVHTRLLLNKQDELRVLESDLRAMDKLDGDNASSRKYLQSRTKDNARQLPPGRISRQQLLDTLEKKTLEYGQLLLQAQQLLSLNRPADRDHQSVINFLENDFPLFEKETSFVYEKEDLVTLRPGRETAFLDAFVERMLKVCHCRPIQVST
ncbi:hypothetical protein MMC13_003885 [Lambiella insularis]|nr:hypothetical protein [Lambiella insularis]